MDSVDQQLLDIIQTGFPLTPRPYADLGQMLGIAEEERWNACAASRPTRSFAVLAQTFSRPSWVLFPTLCAAKVPDDKMDDFVARMKRLPRRYTITCASTPITSGLRS